MNIMGFREFEFDLPSALLEQLVAVFGSMETAPLNRETPSRIPEAQGVYQLFLRDQLVYIGKTDAEVGLKRRLERHARKTMHRQNLHPDDVGFRAVQILVFSAMDLETALIKRYEALGQRTAWNHSGFGANDPGRNRDNTRVRDTTYDARYPINIDRSLEVDFSRRGTAAHILTTLKETLPYVLRFAGGTRGRTAHPDLEATPVSLPNPPYTTRDLLVAITTQLPPGWQATCLPGYAILYKEHQEYMHGTILARSS